MTLKCCNNKIKGISSLISAILINLVTGNLFTFPNLISYYEVFAEHKFTKKQLYFVAPSGILFFKSLSSVMGILDDKFGTRILNIAASILLLGSQLLIYFFKIYALLIIAYALFGVAASLTYYQSLKNCWKYFPNRKGMISGIVLSCFGLSPFISISIADGVIKSDEKGEKKEEEIKKGFKLYLIIVLISIIAAGTLSSVLCFPFKRVDRYIPSMSLIPEGENEEQNQKDENQNLVEPINEDKDNESEKEDEKKIETEDEKKEDNNNEGENKKKGKTLKETILSKDFLLCLAIDSCTLIFGYLLTNTYRTFGEISFINENEKSSEEEKAKMKNYLKILSKVFTLLNTFSRILWGFITDRFKFKTIYPIVCVLQIICAASIYFSTGHIIAYFIVANLGALSFSGHIILFPNLIHSKFGVDKSVYLLGICGIFSGIAALIGPILTLFVLKEKKDYLIIYLVGGAPTIASLFISIFIKIDPKPKEENKSIENSGKKEEEVIKNESKDEEAEK